MNGIEYMLYRPQHVSVQSLWDAIQYRGGYLQRFHR